MRCTITDHYQDEVHHLEGNENDVRAQVLTLYPFLLVKYGPYADLDILLKTLDKSQFASVSIGGTDFAKSENTESQGIGLHIINHDPQLPHGQFHTADDLLEAYKEAAEFLTNKTPNPEQFRAALMEADGDPELTVLLAFDLPAEAVKDLRAVLSNVLQKSENEGEVPSFKDILPTTGSATKFAEIVKAAVEKGEIEQADFKGKHAVGMLIAKDPETHESYILKPGSGKQNPILGESESGSTQSQRETAFYTVACAFGVGQYVPECHLLLLDGKQYAVMKMLPRNFKNMNDLKQQDPNLPSRLFHLYNDGTLHKWATLDFVTGNPDRHSGNVMVSGETIMLIDHGSAFAGISFGPATDGRSFVPYYLRAGVRFKSLSVTEKLRKMPRLNPQNEAAFKKWLLDLKADLLPDLVAPYGIDPLALQARLEKLQRATAYQSADLAILSAWVVG